VLFTADLRTFSERLVTSTTTTEVTEKVSLAEDGQIKTEYVEQAVKVEEKRVKRASEKDEHQVLEIEAKAERKTKRRRRLP